MTAVITGLFPYTSINELQIMHHAPCSYALVTGSGLIKTGPGQLVGVVVSSTTSGTLKFWDNTSAAGNVIIDTITPAAAANIGFGEDIYFANGLYVTVANTIVCTVLFK